MSDEISGLSLADMQRQRDEARAQLRSDISTLRQDLAEHSIPARIGERATETALDTLQTAKDVAAENKIVIGATFAGLLGWFLRRPIARLWHGGAPRIFAKWWPLD